MSWYATLFDVSYEYGIHQGFGLIPGVIRPISGVIPRGYKIPKIGWNRAFILTDAGRCDPIYSALKNDTDKGYVYFVHSFYADCPDEYVIARDICGVPMTASVRRGNVAGVQFHPEKSGSLGLSPLRGFCFNESNMSNICPEDINIGLFFPPSTFTAVPLCAFYAVDFEQMTVWRQRPRRCRQAHEKGRRSSYSHRRFEGAKAGKPVNFDK